MLILVQIVLIEEGVPWNTVLVPTILLTTSTRSNTSLTHKVVGKGLSILRLLLILLRLLLSWRDKLIFLALSCLQLVVKCQKLLALLIIASLAHLH
jgi:hypothetical protein